MTDTNTSPPTFPTPETGEGATTATGTANAGSPHPGSNSVAPLATMPEPSTAEVPTNPFSDLVAASHANDNNPAASSGGGVTAYAPPAGPPPPPLTSSGSPLPPQQPPRPQEGQQNEQPSDPRVAGLKAMFPDYDDLVLLSVLDSVNGNQERAIDLLLGMSDPNYVGESQPAQQQTQQQPPSGAAHAPQANQVGMTQEELDEQFARQLMLEEQQQQQQEWESQYRVRQNRPRFQQPARPDQHGWQPQGAQGGQNQGGDTVTDLQQSFNRIAESGKKTFGSIFSKVKAKIQEMDQPRPGQSGSGAPPNTNPSTYPSAYQYGAGGGAGSDPWESSNYESRVSTNPPQIPATTRPQGLGSPSPPPTQPAAAPIVAPTAVPATQGYDVTPEPARETTPTPSMPVVTSGSGPASPPRTGSGFGATTPKPIDAGKLGLLPRKPVSLVRPENKAPPQPVARQDSEDSDGLEYAESPFDDHRK